MNIEKAFGSGSGGTEIRGWFVYDFLGVWGYNIGVNVVPLTITDGVTGEQSALVAGVTGYTVTKREVTEPLTDTRYPSVQPAHGWGLLMKEDSVFH